MIKLPARFGRNALLSMLLAAGVVACGQRGPLELPEKLRPVQRVEPPPAATPTPTTAPKTQDDEQKDER
jgi:predicted small lipoprotein YifL